MEQHPNIFQRIAAETHGVVTPANVLDLAAFIGTIKYAKQVDTTKGLIGTGLSFFADFGDGLLARSTGTVSELGAAIDPVGDKIKLGYAALFLDRRKVVPRPLLGVVVLHNIANAAATSYDRLNHDEPQIVASTAGKRSTFSNNVGLGLYAIGSELERQDMSRAAKTAKVAGTALVVGGLLMRGIPATVEYWRTAVHPAPKIQETQGARA